MGLQKKAIQDPYAVPDDGGDKDKAVLDDNQALSDDGSTFNVEPDPYSYIMVKDTLIALPEGLIHEKPAREMMLSSHMKELPQMDRNNMYVDSEQYQLDKKNEVENESKPSSPLRKLLGL